MKTKVALLQFPGSNCDQDCALALKHHFSVLVKPVWHSEVSLPAVDGVVIPGGFSYGDYLRSGALASHSPVMAALRLFIKKGGPVFGICNGFQILTESGLLPGVLLRNSQQQFICRQIGLAVDKDCKVKGLKTLKGNIYKMPIAHGNGRYYANKESLKRMRGEGQIFLRYVDEKGKPSDESNPNGSIDNIAGVASENGKIIGMMPHPERAVDELTGSNDALAVWKAFLALCG